MRKIGFVENGTIPVEQVSKEDQTTSPIANISVITQVLLTAKKLKVLDRISDQQARTRTRVYDEIRDHISVKHRPTFKELRDELRKYYKDYDDYLEKGKNKDSEILLNTSTSNYSKLPKPKNEENFERELEELTEYFSHI
ncbi:hypothetical protein Glove_255g17 [Diversispora epigaea]|uniref:Uncharacterized protein n=1 Tax=Diversispora epigaea TaxID=1348612 RepID=A0A397I806_9GLOM|nr:hypothetical protein Glove_255g17 [Diversispora epigaea]